jgi:pimeloyl-ACP methyl ester carboxylesterase
MTPSCSSRPPTIVMLHALAMTGSMWAGTAGALRGLGWRVIVPDLRGHGRTPLGRVEEDIDVLALDVLAELDAAGVEDIVLVGASMGGYAAMAFLRHVPGRVRALALTATRAAADSAVARAGREALAEKMLDAAARRRVIDQTVPRFLGADSRAGRPDLLGTVQASVEATPGASIAWAQRAIARRPDFTDLLRQVDVPALVIAGEQDELVGLPEAEATAGALPAGELVRLPRVGHLPPLEAPEQITAAMMGLLARASGRSIA